MKLNRYNYEEYFILYLDNELDSESRREVEAFAEQNPDLRSELDMLMQSKLTPDADISFIDKGSLLRFDSSSISLTNYEEWLTSYIDDELTEEERKDVEQFIASNPAVQKELDLLLQTKLQPEPVVFPYKESLYRKEEKARVISVHWMRIAVAAILLLAVSATAIVLMNNRKKNDNNNSVAHNEPDGRKNSANEVAADKPGISNPSVDAGVTVDKSAAREKTGSPKKEQDIKGTAKHNNKSKEKNEQPVDVKKDESLAGLDNNEKKPSNNLARPESNPYVNGLKNEVPVNVGEPSPEFLTPSAKIADKSVVTTSNLQPSDLTEQPSGNKGLRGFLRKVTRTFEKRTNIKATDDDDRLLIAGLAIKMN